MYKYIVEYYQNGEIICEKAELKLNDDGKWYHSYNYYGSSTREGSPIIYIHENNELIYKTFGFTLIKINTQNNVKIILGEYVIIDEFIEYEITNFKEKEDNNILLDKPNANSQNINIKMKGIGNITFGIRDLDRWPGKPGEIKSCCLIID